MLVLHLLHQLDLSLNRLASIWLLEFVFLVYFHGNFTVCRPVETDANARIRSLTDLLPDDVVV